MKRLFSILVLAVFFLSLSSFSKIDKEVDVRDAVCDEVAKEVYYDALADGQKQQDAANAHQAALMVCTYYMGGPSGNTIVLE